MSFHILNLKLPDLEYSFAEGSPATEADGFPSITKEMPGKRTFKRWRLLFGYREVLSG